MAEVEGGGDVRVDGVGVNKPGGRPGSNLLLVASRRPTAE